MCAQIQVKGHSLNPFSRTMYPQYIGLTIMGNGVTSWPLPPRLSGTLLPTSNDFVDNGCSVLLNFQAPDTRGISPNM